MSRNDRRFLANIIEIVIGAALLVLGIIGIIDEFWTGMGTADVYPPDPVSHQ